MTDPEESSGPGPTEPRHLDGNAAAGPLAELFTVELSAATVVCAHCGRSAPLAEHRLYADAPALVLRCPTCAGVVLRYASGDGRLRLDFTGARLITVVTGERTS